MDQPKPLPNMQDADALPYWNAAKAHRLDLQCCPQCNVFLYPPGPTCPHCGGFDVPYNELGSLISGQLYSYIVTHRAFVPGFSDEVPYIVALVEVEQAGNIKLLANLINCKPENVRIGMPLKMVWEDRTPEISIPQWAVE